MIDPDFVPSTVKEAVQHIYSRLSPADRMKMKGNPRIGAIHFVQGMALRNSWSLWEKETPLKKDAVQNYGIAHADDITGLIFRWVFAKVLCELFDPQAACEIFRAHWAEQGTTPLEVGGYNEDGTPK